MPVKRTPRKHRVEEAPKVISYFLIDSLLNLVLSSIASEGLLVLSWSTVRHGQVCLNSNQHFPGQRLRLLTAKNCKLLAFRLAPLESDGGPKADSQWPITFFRDRPGFELVGLLCRIAELPQTLIRRFL